MYISKLTLENYKGFKGVHEFTFKPGVTFFVGNNNCGKSTVLEAIEFLKNGLGTRGLEDILTKGVKGPVTVIAEFSGDVETATKNSGLKKYESYILEQNGEKVLRLKRSSQIEKVKQNGREKELGIKAIRFYNGKAEQYENPTGADSTVGALFETQFIWADTNPDDVSDFGSTKICGKLINRAVGDFFDSTQWESFKAVHKSTFKEGETSLAEKVKPLAAKIEKIIKEQYGETEVRFDFSLPDIPNFIKTGNIALVDEGIDTSSKHKGTGMQRALALSLIQVYAETSASLSEEEKLSKPIFFFIDEPETFLHPRAQYKLLDALEVIAEDSQIFLTTHSPYLLKRFSKASHALYAFSKDSGGNKAVASSNIGIFGSSSPTWGEINYFAFDVVSQEFHNELYGHVWSQAAHTSTKPRNFGEEDFDEYLERTKGLPKNKTWVRVWGDGTTKSYPSTLQTYVRNFIHHPENVQNPKFTDEELRISIEGLVSAV